jgi:hypothetical protein
LLPEQEARATKVERDALRAEVERLADVLRWLDKLGGLGYEKHDRIRAALAPKDQANVENEALRADNERLRRVLERIPVRRVLSRPAGRRGFSPMYASCVPHSGVSFRMQHCAYTREEMREACRNNYHAGAAVGADLVAKVAQLRADVAAMGNALADYFDNGSDYSTGAKVRAIAERQGAKNG